MATEWLTIWRGSWAWPRAATRPACASSLALAAALSGAPALAAPAPAIDIPAGPLVRGLEALAKATGLSFGTDSAIPNVRAPAVRGRLSAEAALARLLDGSGLRAIRIGPNAFRLVVVAHAPRPVPAVAPAPVEPPAPDIVVTVLRRPLALADVPASIVRVTPEAIVAGRGAAAGSDAIAAETPALALTRVGQGRNRQFVRGVADSPFNGLTQGTVAIVLDGSRVTYDAPDPDLRLVDIARVELLKGSQGPLYGTGALGGVYHIVTNRPDLAGVAAEVDGFAGVTEGGSAAFGGSAMLNLPLVADRLGARAVGWSSHDPGWIDRPGRPNANRGDVIGGRLGLRWAPDARWTIDLAGMFQNMAIADSQYVPRAGAIAEPHDNDFRSLALEANGRIGATRLTLSSSAVGHEVASVFDATAAAARLGFPAGPLRWRDDRSYSVLDQELRLSGDRWLAGLSWLSARTSFRGSAGAPGGSERAVLRFNRAIDEFAAFGQASLKLGSELRAEAGLRVFTARVEDEGGREGAPAAALARRRVSLSPSLALLWSRSPTTRVWARVARGSRTAGLGIADDRSARAYDGDRLTSVELGIRHGDETGPFTLDAALFAADWRRLQADYLLSDGLIGTRNAGDAGLVGAEATLTWRPLPGWRLRLLGLAQRAHLRDGGTDTPDDRRLPVVPELAGSVSVARALALGGWRGEVQLDARFQGATRLSFDPGLDRTTPGYAIIGGRIGVTRDGWRISLAVDNLLNSRADIFAGGNPFSLLVTPQRTPLQPRAVGLGLSRRF